MSEPLRAYSTTISKADFVEVRAEAARAARAATWAARAAGAWEKYADKLLELLKACK